MEVDGEAVEVEILVSVAHALDDVEHQLDTFDVVADVDPRNWYTLWKQIVSLKVFFTNRTK